MGEGSWLTVCNKPVDTSWLDFMFDGQKPPLPRGAFASPLIEGRLLIPSLIEERLLLPPLDKGRAWGGVKISAASNRLVSTP